MKLGGKTAIVTAAGRGIGRGIALRLAEEGADIVTNSFREETTARTAGEVEALGRRAVAISGDISKADKVVQVVREAIETFGKIDILVNNVGGGPSRKKRGDGPLGEMEARWDGSYEQNLKASVLMSEAMAPHFTEKNSGKIVNIGSIAGRGSSSATLLANFGSPSYYAMKASLINYTQTLAERLGPHNVNVNCICPGVVPTDAWETHKQRAVQTMPEFNEMDPDEWFDGVVQDRYPHIFRTIPLRRETSVDDIAQAVLFLVSEDGKNITGQSINVDGGAVKS